IDQGIPYDLDRYRKTVAVNLDGPVHGVHAALPLMRGRQGASILVTSSMAGLFAPPSGEVYAATKHALIGFVRSLALTLADDPLTVNAICPGYVEDRKSTRLNSSHVKISYAVFCLKKKK